VLDHTSVLKFIADKFTPSQPYSAAVGQRAVASVTEALTRISPRTDIPLPGSAVAGYSSGARPTDPTPIGFQKALAGLRNLNQDATDKKFPEIAELRQTGQLRLLTGPKEIREWHAYAVSVARGNASGSSSEEWRQQALSRLGSTDRVMQALAEAAKIVVRSSHG